MKGIRKRLQRSIRKIGIVDKSLIFFMIILISQSAYSLFVTKPDIDTGTIDVIVRTSAAAIFGYFLSGNFIKNCSKDMSDEASALHHTPPGRCIEMQIIIVSAIGIASLVVLLLFRNYGTPSLQTAVTVSQLRDFVSACVGFLVSSDKER